MEEDIKILREYLDSGDQYIDYYFSHGCGDALENLIKRYRKLEKRNNRQFKLLQERDKNTIPKSKIKEKIEELETKKKKYGFASLESNILLNQIIVLQKLMEDK